jgi:hypothetical protein
MSEANYKEILDLWEVGRYQQQNHSRAKAL